MIKSILISIAVAIAVVVAFRFWDKKQAEKALGK